MKTTLRSLCGLIALFALSLDTHAQLSENYIPIQSQGNLPQEFTQLSSRKYELEKKKAGKSNDIKKNKTFYERNYYSVDNLLLSGKVLFNDTLTRYINLVADSLLSTDKVTRGQVRFYVLKSTSVNAFATHQGAIFITMGLLARLHNEAELAFILSHEIVHFKEKHAIREYTEVSKIDKGRNTYKKIGLQETMLRKCIFSKDQEREADQKGLEIFLKSNYSFKELPDVFEVLKYAEQPFDTLSFNTAFLIGGMKFPVDLNALNPVDSTDQLNDELSTHPNLKYRKETIQAALEKADTADRKTWLVSQATFGCVKEFSKFELCKLYLLNEDFEQAIYSAYSLLAKYPRNLYLQKIIATSLASMGEYVMHGYFEKMHEEPDSLKGIQQSMYLFSKKMAVHKPDFTLLGLSYTKKLLVDYPGDSELEYLYNYCLKSLVRADYKTAYLIDGKKEGDDSLGLSIIVPEALALNSDERLKADLKKTEREFKKAQDIAIYESSENSGKKKRNVYDTRLYHLGLDKVVTVDPYFARVNANKHQKFKYMESESGQVDLVERLKQTSKFIKLDMPVLSSKNLKTGEVDKLNDIADLNDYLRNVLAGPNDVKLPIWDKAHIAQLAKKYGTTNFMWTGVISLTDKNLVSYGWLALAIMYPPTWPFILPGLINGGNRTYYFSLILDITTNELKMSVSREIENKSTPNVLNSHMYDVLTQIKSKAK